MSVSDSLSPFSYGESPFSLASSTESTPSAAFSSMTIDSQLFPEDPVSNYTPEYFDLSLLHQRGAEMGSAMNNLSDASMNHQDSPVDSSFLPWAYLELD